jgi:hypothetical protein
MKRCPKCHLEYFDNTLEFCLEDGARLFNISAAPVKEVPTISRQQPLTDEKTVSFTAPETAAAERETFRLDPNRPPTPIQPRNLHSDEKLEQAGKQELFPPPAVSSQALKALEIAPIVLALAHNWWQWIYLNNQYYPSLAAFLLSANFLMWLLLFAVGAAAGLLALKFGRSKGFAYAGLVILAINLLLFLVPKR